MSRFQEKLDSMTDNEFVKKYIAKKRDNVRISEKRHLYKKSKKVHGVMADLYNVAFEYTLVKEPGLFSNKPEMAVRVVNDPVILMNDADDADKYMENVLYPAQVYFRDPSGDLMFDMYVKGYDRYVVKGHWHTCYSVSLHVYEKGDLLGNSVAYGPNFKRLMENLTEYIEKKDKHTVKHESRGELIKTVCINDIANITDTSIREIKESIDETNDYRKAVVMSEIERTKDYLSLLNKLL